MSGISQVIRTGKTRYFPPGTAPGGPFVLTANNGNQTINAVPVFVPVTNISLGNLLAFTTISFAGQTFSSISGGGVTTWNVAGQRQVASAFNAALVWGLVTATGSQTITLNMSSNNGGIGAWGEFASLIGGVISQDGSAVSAAATATNSLTLPTLTPSLGNELCIISAYPVGGGTVTFPSGFTQANINYDGNLSGPISAVLNQSTSGDFVAVAALFKA